MCIRDSTHTHTYFYIPRTVGKINHIDDETERVDKKTVSMEFCVVSRRNVPLNNTCVLCCNSILKVIYVNRLGIYTAT